MFVILPILGILWDSSELYKEDPDSMVFNKETTKLHFLNKFPLFKLRNKKKLKKALVL